MVYAFFIKYLNLKNKIILVLIKMSYKDNTTLYILFSETTENQGYTIAHFNDIEEDHSSPSSRFG